MSKKQKKNLFRIILTALIMAVLFITPITGLARLVLWVAAYLIIGYDILIKAFKGIKNRQPLDENLLMTIATLGAMALAIYEKSGDYAEAVAVMFFYQIGEWFQGYAIGKSRKNISELMDIIPDYANIENGDGELEQVDPDDVEIGTVIVVKPGERLPIDGIVVDGISSLDTAALTGESVPRDVKPGEEVVSGCINLSGLLKIRTTKEFGESTASKVMELIEDASSRKSKSENFISKFARVYTPVVVLSALALAVLPPVVLLLSGHAPGWGTWVYRALTFLVISCPCALVVSIPLSFFAGIGGASKRGILVKGSNYLELLSEAKTVVFDKTGTLTRGVFAVDVVHPNLQSPMSGHTLDAHELLHLAAHLERFSTHPIAQALREAYPDEAHDGCTVDQVQEFAGGGIIGRVNGREVVIGNRQFIADTIGSDNIRTECCQDKAGTLLHVVVDNTYAGHILISDQLKAKRK
jgi:Cd2+/Zn2+-exporting ATPase